jgi:hypothetical protein
VASADAIEIASLKGIALADLANFTADNFVIA